MLLMMLRFSAEGCLPTNFCLVAAAWLDLNELESIKAPVGAAFKACWNEEDLFSFKGYSPNGIYSSSSVPCWDLILERILAARLL